MRTLLAGLLLAFLLWAPALAAPETERRYLSGLDAASAVPWEFTVTGGRRAGEKATIPVPSNWEQHGFGSYNYGEESGGPKADEHGLYRLRFAVPEAWKGRRVRLVFEGVMTDATVKVNGKSAGSTHHGAFYRFAHDVSALVTYGPTADNVLEVDVAKVSADPKTESAERGGDYWVFGGIFRPVWLEASPIQAIDHAAIDARADGTLTADVTLTAAREATALQGQILDGGGNPAAPPFTTRIPAGGAGRLRVAARLLDPRLWSAETPNLYTLRLTLMKGEEALHTTSHRFGFRTFEVRPGEGLFLNGQRILLKGVNRHSFRPATARTLSREDSYADARLIRSMNMNAARMSHYPPDEAFLEAADELGLYVLNELSGWHRQHGTENGRKLIRAMVERDVNHPSILFWDNANEGGWNRELDGEFALWDPQKRRVLHPWELHDDVDTKHYPPYADAVRRLQGPHVFLPTEFLHGLFDGGAGAGIEDYWKAISASPVGAGGFIWVFADEGVARTDRSGRIDVVGTYAPDGVVGPNHEKEGSFETLRDVFSPVQVTPPRLDAAFDGTLEVRNAYDFTSLDQVRFAWSLLRYPGPAEKAAAPRVLAGGRLTGPAVAPHAAGRLRLPLPASWRQADALALDAIGPDGQPLWTWTWATPALGDRLAGPSVGGSRAAPRVNWTTGEIRLVAGSASATFDAATGLLRSLSRSGRSAVLANGPRLAFARPESAASVEWIPFATEDLATQTRRLAAPHLANTVAVGLDYQRSDTTAGFRLEISPDGRTWKTIYDASRRAGDGDRYNFPPQLVAAVRLSNVLRRNGGAMEVKSVRLGYAPGRFPAPSTAPVVTTGAGRDPATGRATAWIESRGGGLESMRWTLQGDGSLQLDYRYALEGDALYHGVTFDHPEPAIRSVRRLTEGPFRVWRNRLRGPTLGVHEVERDDRQPGEVWGGPEFQGYFAGLRWARLDTTAGPLTVTSRSPEVFLRVGTPRISHINTTADFPAGDLSFLHAIPGMGSKFVKPENSGPSGEPNKANGVYSGSLVFRW